MKRFFNLFVLVTLLALNFGAAGVTPAQAKPLYALGTYSTTFVGLGGNTTVVPDVPPTGTTSINVSTDTNFKGTFAADPTTGVVRVTNAHPAGTYTVTVKAFGASPATTTFTLTVTSGAACTATPGFTSATDVSTASPSRSSGVGDFNNDGNQDFAALSYATSAVSIRLGNGDGTFTSAADVTVGTGENMSIAIGDFNNDGNQDFASTNYTSSTIFIRLGNGDGTFANAADVAFPQSYSIAVGDFNDDGNQDLAVGNYSGNVGIFLGNGDGTFAAGTVNNIGGLAAYSIAIGDFNKDGKQDFAAGTVFSHYVAIRLGNGDGTFSSAANVSMGASAPGFIAIGDFNNDGQQDLAITNGNSYDIAIRIGNGDGTFSGTTNLSLEGQPVNVAVGDFNNDGNQDWAVGVSSGAVVIRLGNGAGTFTAIPNISADRAFVAVGDFNNDGKQDIAGAHQFFSSGVAIRLGGCTAALTYTAGSGGSVTAPATSPTTHNAGAVVTITAVPNLGYHFVNWTGDVGTVANVNAASTTITMNGDYNITANFAIDTHTLAYTAGAGGSITAPATSPTTHNYGAVVTITAVPNLGYHFVNWTGNVGTVANVNAASTTITMNGDYNITANFAADTYTVSFDAQGGSPTPGNQTVAYGALVTAPGNPSLTGYTFNGWYTASTGGTQWNFASNTMGAGNMTLYAHWTLNSYTVSFDAQGGSPTPGNQTVAYGALVTAPGNPSLTGYTFNGWYTASTGGTQWNFASNTMGAGNMTLYAHWTLNSYTVSFDAQGGSPTPGNQTVAYGALVTAPGNPSLTGYTFNGWFTASTGGTQWNFASNTMGAGNMTLYAHWLDATPPTLHLPANMTVAQTTPLGAVVTFSATATDLVAPPNPAVTCVPPSGSTFPLGATPVNCSATDTAGNTAHGSFTVNVIPALTTPQLLKMPTFDNLTKPIPWTVKLPTIPFASVRDCTVSLSPNCSVKFVGKSTNPLRYAEQSFIRRGNAGDKFYIGLSSRAESVPAGGLYKVEVFFYNLRNQVVGSQALNFSIGTHDWETVGTTYTVPAAYYRVAFRFTYQKTAGTAWFDNAFLMIVP